MRFHSRYRGPATTDLPMSPAYHPTRSEPLFCSMAMPLSGIDLVFALAGPISAAKIADGLDAQNGKLTRMPATSRFGSLQRVFRGGESPLLNHVARLSVSGPKRSPCSSLRSKARRCWNVFSTYFPAASLPILLAGRYFQLWKNLEKDIFQCALHAILLSYGDARQC